MILKARHHPIVYPFFKWYTLWKVERVFKTVNITGDYHENNLPLLLIANHVSWWDGFWVSYLNLKVFRRKYHFMMLEKQLKMFPILNKTGGYSIKRGNKSVLESLQYTSELLKDYRNAILLFPQGRIQSIFTASFEFEKGIERMLQMVKNKIQIMFIVNLIDYFSHPDPGLYIFFKEYDGESSDIVFLQNEYNLFFSSCISQQRQKKDL
jgi:1-acyl-sn-glycerol-3-phosphate acyltransferase